MGAGVEAWRGGSKESESELFLIRSCYHGRVFSDCTHLVRRIIKDNMVSGILPFAVSVDTVM